MTTFTSNIGLVVDPTGSNVGTWADVITNPDFVAIDGMLAGVQTISVASTPVTLTSPATFTPTPGGGATQSQNRVLRFTGTLTANVTVTLPIPGAYIVENLTTGNFVLSFRGVTATEVIGTPQGEAVNIYNDGANVRFVGLARTGVMELWAGISAIPAWVTACTVAPYLLCDGSVKNYSAYPFLGPKMGSKYGGNGITTFATPSMQGRVPLAYDSTGTRITTAGCGINGQTLGAAGGYDSIQLSVAQMPSHRHAVFVYDPGHDHAYTDTSSGTHNNSLSVQTSGGLYTSTNNSRTTEAATGITIGSYYAASDDQTAATGGGDVHSNVQPAIVIGVWVIKT